MKRLVYILIVLSLLVPVIAHAQAPLTESYRDDLIAFQYPAGWFVTATDDGITVLSNTEDGLLAGWFEASPGVITIRISGFYNDTGENYVIEERDPKFVAGYFAGVLTIVLSFLNYDQSLTVFSELIPVATGYGQFITVKGTVNTTLLAVSLGNGVFMGGYAPSDEIGQWKATIFAIAETIELVE